MSVSEKKTILCFGDSNTHGYDASGGGRFSESERWPRLLGDALGSGFSVIEEGLSGRTAAFDDPLFEGLNGLSYLYPCLMTHEPVDLLIIMLGTNDTKIRFSATPENITKGIERLCRRAIDAKEAWRNGIPRLLLIAPPPILPAYAKLSAAGEMGPDCDAKSAALAPLYRACAKQLGCAFLDAGTLEGVCMEAADAMHLTKTGHRLLAEHLAKLLPSLF